MPAVKKRPVDDPARPARLEARLSREQKDLLQRAADLQGRTLTDFVVASAHQAALRAIEEMETIRLGSEESLAFAEAMLNPREPAQRLRTAARRYLETAAG